MRLGLPAIGAWAAATQKLAARNAKRRQAAASPCKGLWGTIVGILKDYLGKVPPPLRTRDFTLMPDVFFMVMLLSSGRKPAGRVHSQG
jgi:hypothetical protein